MLIDQTSSVRTVQLTLPELRLSWRTPMPGTAAKPRHGMSQAHLCLQTAQADWRGMGEVCVQSEQAASLTQGGRIAGYGAYDVTDTKFSTSMGPPTCSPPV